MKHIYIVIVILAMVVNVGCTNDLTGPDLSFVEQEQYEPHISGQRTGKDQQYQPHISGK
jgi:hypothetical protein